MRPSSTRLSNGLKLGAAVALFGAIVAWPPWPIGRMSRPSRDRRVRARGRCRAARQRGGLGTPLGRLGPPATALLAHQARPAPAGRAFSSSPAASFRRRWRCSTSLDRAQIDELRARGEFFWLDLSHPTDEDIDTPRRDARPAPDGARGHARRSGSGRSSTTTSDYVLLVFYGARMAEPDDGTPELLEVALYISGDVDRDRPPRPLRGARRGARRRLDRARARRRAVRRLPHPRRAHRQLLPGARRNRRRDRRARGARCSPTRPTSSCSASSDSSASSSRCGAVVTPQRDMFARARSRTSSNLPGLEAGAARLLPRRLRPPDPDLGPHRLLPRPALRRDGRLPLDRLQPAQRRHEAAHDRRDDLPAAAPS